MNQDFSSPYALAYDLLNEGKPYKEEVDFILHLYETFADRGSLPTNVLDLGCGSGMHLSKFPSSVKKTGVDLSESMLTVAAKRNLPNTSYVHTNIGSFHSDEQFDLVYSLFHVMSYQTTESDLGQALRTIHDSLANNGLAIFDFWHRAAWDNDPPVARMTSRMNSLVEVKRFSSPVLDHLTGLVSIDMDIFVHNIGMEKEMYLHFSEHHEMRAYTLQELNFAAKLADLDVVGCGPWMTTNRQLAPSDWYGWVILQSKL
jgi:SAM-dependent methyltransferase